MEGTEQVLIIGIQFILFPQEQEGQHCERTCTGCEVTWFSGLIGMGCLQINPSLE